MDKDTLFLKTIEDVENKMKSKDAYEILMISGLLRKLLLDDYPLTDQVNKNRRLKISFVINDRKPPFVDASLEFWSIEDGFDPDTSVPHLSKPLAVDRERLLNSEIMIVNREVITVFDLIKFLSHVLGAIHAGSPKTSKEIALNEINKYLKIGGLPAGIRSILAVSRVVLKGLEPLRKSVVIDLA